MRRLVAYQLFVLSLPMDFALVLGAQVPSTTHPDNAASISVIDWGADPSGKSDSSKAFASALSAARGPGQRGGRIVIPPGNYSIGSTIAVTDFYGLEIEGSGWKSTLIWAGSTEGPIMLFEGNFGTHVHDLMIVANAQHPVDTGILIRDGGDRSPTSQGLDFQDVWIEGVDGYLKDGFVVEGTDLNNDFHHFTNVRVSNFTDAAWWLKGSQSYSHRFDHCHAAGYSKGLYGVKATSSKGLGGSFAASFSWNGGDVSSRLWDFYIDGTSDYPYVISGTDNESQGGLVYATGGMTRHIIVRDIRWARAGGDSADPTFAHVAGGSLTFLNSTIESTSPKTRQLLTLFYSGGGTNFPGTLTIRDTLFITSNFTLASFLTGDKPNSQSPILENAAWDDDLGNRHGWFEPSSYSEGRVDLTQGSALIVGEGTSFSPAMTGGFISIQGKIFGIRAVTDPTHLSLDKPFTGPSLKEAPYLAGYGATGSYVPEITLPNAVVGDEVVNSATIHKLKVDQEVQFTNPETVQSATCPAHSCTSPAGWIKVHLVDGSVAWVPVYR